MRGMLLGWVLACGALGADDSGPKVGDAPKELKAFAVAGEFEGKEVDFVAERAKKSTVYLFVRADAFDRPMARFMKAVDEAAGKVDDASVVAVWLTDDVDKSKEYLPKAQGSLKFVKTTLAVYGKEKAGPAEWKVNGDSRITAVVVKGGKVTKSWGFGSVNETDATEVAKELGAK